MDMARAMVSGKDVLIFVLNCCKLQLENVLENEFDCVWKNGLESILESWIHHASQYDHCEHWVQEQEVWEWGLGDLGASEWAQERWRAVVSIISGASKSGNLNLHIKVNQKKYKVLQNAYIAIPFVIFDTKSLASEQKNSNILQEDKIFFPNLYKSIQNFYILMDFYLFLSMGVCPRSSQLNG